MIETATPEPEATLPDLPDEEAINSALLTPDDLPVGWTLADERIAEEPCGIRFRQGLRGGVTALEYPNDPAAPYIYHEIAAFDPGGAQAELDYIIDTIESCPSSLSTSPDGDVVASFIDPIVVQQLGDDSFGFREVVPGRSESFVTDTIYIRRGDLLSILVITTPGDLDEGFAGFVDTLAETADEKLAQIAY